MAVAVVDLSEGKRFADRSQLVARGEGRDPHPTQHGYLPDPDRSQQSELSRMQQRAGADRQVPTTNVLADGTDMLAGTLARFDHHAIAVHMHLLLHDHRVGGLGDGRAGHDAYALSPPYLAGERSPRQ